jgi:LPXTG-motif cell wall-anchored protein
VSRADEWDKKTILTVNEPIQVRETLLEPGQYVFKLMNTTADRHVVQIYNSDETHLINTVLAIPTWRVNPTDHSRFSFFETPPGYAKALRAWYYPGNNTGQAFPYPKHLTLLASASTAQTTTQTQSVAPMAPAESQAMAEQSTEVQQPAPAPEPEVAQNTPPPAPEPAPAPAPAALPKTGSDYPLIGLAGLLSLGLFGLMRLRKPVSE